MFPAVRSCPRLLPAFVIIASAALRAEDDNPKPDLKVRGVFETELPRTEAENHLRLIVHPHFGDLTKRDFLRVPVGVRYGLTRQWEVGSDVEGYIAHGLRGVPFASKYGFSGVGFTTKYRFAGDSPIKTATGLNFSRPIGSPPPDVTDGLQHVSPFVTFEHQLPSNPDLSFFFGGVYDFVTRTRIRGERQKNTFTDDSWGLTPGVVWNHGDVHYTMECGLATNAGLSAGDRMNVVTVRPGVTWNVPARYSFFSRGRWTLGLGLRAGFGPDGTDLGMSLKLRGDIDFRRMFGLRPNGPVARP